MKKTDFLIGALFIGIPLVASAAETTSKKVRVATPTLQQFFKGLNKDTLSLVDEFYDEKIVFVDPVGELRGREKIKAYYGHQYENLISIQFDFSADLRSGLEEAGFWTMRLRHKKVRDGAEISVPGSTYVRFSPSSGQVVYHRDYFDLGIFVYENVPGLSTIIRFVKSRMAPH